MYLEIMTFFVPEESMKRALFATILIQPGHCNKAIKNKIYKSRLSNIWKTLCARSLLEKLPRRESSTQLLFRKRGNLDKATCLMKELT